MIWNIQAGGSVVRHRALALTMSLSVGVLGGCGKLLDVELPGSITEASVYEPSQAAVLVTSAISDIECAYSEFVATTASGNDDSFLRIIGWWGGAHEFFVAPNTVNCNPSETTFGWYIPLHKGRYVAEKAYASITGWPAEQVANKERLLAQAAIYSAIAYDVLGEHFCEVTADRGPLMSPDQTLAKSEEYLTKALEHISKSGDFAIQGGVASSAKQMTHLLRARVRWARRNSDGALADARLVTKGFMAFATREGTGMRHRANKVVSGNNDNAWNTVMGPIDWWKGPGNWPAVIPFTGFRDLGILPDGRAITADQYPITTTGRATAIPDRRVPVLDMKKTASGFPHWTQQKYRTKDDDIPLANWQEAWLIRAELEGGQKAIDLVNEIRDFHALPRVTYLSAGDTKAVRDMIIEERRRSLFLEGRFWSTKIRDKLWFPRGVSETPTRQAYGGAIRMVMPDNEFELNEGLQLSQKGTMCGDERPTL